MSKRREPVIATEADIEAAKREYRAKKAAEPPREKKKPGPKPGAGRLTDEEMEWLRRSCEEQGVPFKVTDPATLRKIATLLGRARR